MPTEKFANAASTTLNGAITAAQTSLVAGGSSSFPAAPQFRILIDSELILVTGGVPGLTWTITRGIENTTAASHASGAVITHVVTAGSMLNDPGPMTTPGDMDYLDVNSNMARLPIGVNGSILTVNLGLPTWTSGGVALLNSANIFTANQYIAISSPELVFNDTAQGVDLKKWRFITAGQLFYLQTINDAETTGKTIWVSDRTGNLTVGGSYVWISGNRSQIIYTGDSSTGRLGIYTVTSGANTYIIGYDGSNNLISPVWELVIGSGGAFATQRSRMRLYGDLMLLNPGNVDPETTSIGVNEGVKVYTKNATIIYAWNEGGGVIRYKYMNLFGTDTTWFQTTVTP